ncbi:MAG: septum formation initiator family protein [Verrucomicrobiota bacterium]|jgi:cell division protein FtsB
MESEPTSRNPQTEKLFLWAAFILFCTVLAFTWSTYGDETARLAGLRASEKNKEQAYATLERARAQTERYIDRLARDPEFVRDQARERMGVAEPGEIVIRVDGARNMATPQKPVPAPATPTAQASR